MQNLVIGNGEIGAALASVLDCDVHDPPKSIFARGSYDIIHICIPYSEEFEDIVTTYQVKFNPEHTVIHSTVPVGTSKSLKAAHSPIRGVHPDLEEGIRTFVKYVGGDDADIIAEEFLKRGITTKTFDKAKTAEAGKLLSTTQYGLYIMISKKIHEYCEKNNLDYEKVYKDFNETYNQGYSELGDKKVLRPVFEHIEGQIGGHCVIPNCDLLDWEMAEWLKKENEGLH